MGLMNEALGRAVPVEVQPYVNDALASHPAYINALNLLKEIGVTINPVDYE